MKKDKDKRLQEEREKLNQLVDKALKDGTPISETNEIMKQCRIIKLISEEEDEVLQDEQTGEEPQGG